jgi:hypothetical protein
MRKLVVIAVILSACTATTGLPIAESVHPSPLRSGAASESVHPPPVRIGAASDEAQPWFPARLSELRVPTVDRMHEMLRETGRDRLTARLRLCVAPDGSTSQVRLEATSGVAELDQALVQDLARWRYAAFAAPSHIEICEPVTLTYVLP